MALRPTDWMALLVKHHDTGEALQRIVPVRYAISDSTLAWLSRSNAEGCSVYASVNTLVAGTRSRARNRVAAVRHVFLDIDEVAQDVLSRLARSSELPAPNYIVHTSPGRAHVLWRARDFECCAAERLQKQMAAYLGCDLAATAVTQLTRLPGFRNQKYREPYVVWVEYRDVEHIYTPRDFPSVEGPEPIRSKPVADRWSALGCGRPAERARAYVARVPAAISGDHGDLHTFQICCRVVRGFALDDDQALAVLAEWNARCQPSWTERELLQKIRGARRNGREPIGGLL
ncbi:MAG: DNA-primase RepB domain-containing protein [Vicinamibacterales bacterium]